MPTAVYEFSAPGFLGGGFGGGARSLFLTEKRLMGGGWLLSVPMVGRSTISYTPLEWPLVVVMVMAAVNSFLSGMEGTTERGRTQPYIKHERTHKHMH